MAKILRFKRVVTITNTKIHISFLGESMITIRHSANNESAGGSAKKGPASNAAKHLPRRWIFGCIFLFLGLGASVQSQAGFFDDLGDALKGVINEVDNVFSSTKHVAESVVDKVDTEVIANITGRCTYVNAQNGPNDTDQKRVIEHCGHDIRELKGVFEDVGNRLEEIGKDQWSVVSGPFTGSVVDVLSHYGRAAVDPVRDLSTDLLNAMKDVKNTFSGVGFASNNLSSGTNINFFFTKPFGKVTLDLIVQGSVKNNIAHTGLNFVGIDGKLIVKLKSSSVVGYNPEVSAQLEYVNPIIKLDKGSITGLLVLQPEGAIKLAAAVAPLKFSAGLAKLMEIIPGLNKISVLKKYSKTISFDVEVGTVGLRFPLTNQQGSRFNFDLEVSCAVDAQAKITPSWRVKIIERIKWKQKITLDIPAIQLPLGSVPAGVIGKLEKASAPSAEPSFAEQILAYTFNESSAHHIEDKSGYGNHATAIGGVTFKEGTVRLNGKDGYIHLPDDLMKNLDAITVYAEVNIDKQQASPYFIYGLGNTKGDRGDGYLFTTGDLYRSALSGCHWICEQSIYEDNTRVPRSSWQKLVYTLQDNVATLYLNGDVVSRKTDMTLKPSHIGGGRTAANYIGRPLYSGDKYFHGAIRNFQVWDGALSHKEILDQFGASAHGTK